MHRAMEYSQEVEGAEAFIDRRAECHVDKHGGDLAAGPGVAQDLGQFADQDAAIARVFAGDPDPRDGPRIGAAAVSDHVPGGTAARNIHTADQWIVVQALRLALLGFQDARTVDELEFVGRRRQTADADAGKIAVTTRYLAL